MRLVFQTNEWFFLADMHVGREHSSSAYLSFDEWWITGGYTEPPQSTITDLLLSTSSSFVRYLNLPIPMKEHIMIRVNETAIIFIGNCCDTDGMVEYNDLVVIFDKTTLTFSNLPSLPFGVIWPSGGLVRHSDGRNSVLISGNPTQILDLDNLSAGWTQGPDYFIRFADSVPFGDSFLSVGGRDFTGSYSNNIHEYDAESGSWKVRPEKLTTGRELSAAFLIPDDVARCS